MSLCEGILAIQESEALLLSDLNYYHYNIVGLIEALRKFLMNKPAMDPLC